MKSIFHLAASRGKVSFGWLNSYHSFSFGQFHDAQKMNFGALRVLNDDRIIGGSGFGKHPHDNMEIVSIPLSGGLEHEDSTGRKAVIKQNDVQIMSAGTGLQHAEKNHSENDETSFLQIWVLPKDRNIKPRYDQKTFDPAERKNKIQTIVSPNNDETVWINQDAWFSLTNLDEGKKVTYNLNKEGNGVYVFLLSGTLTVNGTQLNTRDGLGIWESEQVELEATSQAEVLLIEVPMKIN